MITDFHSHILPGIDDGSQSVEESLRMLRLIREQGIRQVVATPHFYPRHDSPERFLARRQAAAERLREAMRNEPDLPEILLGAEVYFFHGISESEVLSQLTIEKKCCILIEMPQSPWTDQMYRELEGIREKQGLTPIIAHVDRYIRPFHTHKIPARLEKLPVLVQANASFFQEKGTRSMALKMLRSGGIHLLGSDCHNLDSRRPNLDQAMDIIRQKLGAEALERIARYQDLVLQE